MCTLVGKYVYVDSPLAMHSSDVQWKAVMHSINQTICEMNAYDNCSSINFWLLFLRCADQDTWLLVATASQQSLNCDSRMYFVICVNIVVPLILYVLLLYVLVKLAMWSSLGREKNILMQNTDVRFTKGFGLTREKRHKVPCASCTAACQLWTRPSSLTSASLTFWVGIQSCLLLASASSLIPSSHSSICKTKIVKPQSPAVGSNS